MIASLLGIKNAICAPPLAVFHLQSPICQYNCFMSTLYQGMKRRDSLIYLLGLSCLVLFNTAAVAFRMFDSWWHDELNRFLFIFFFIYLAVQLPYLYDIYLVSRKRPTSPLGLYLVVMSMDFLIILAMLIFLLTIISNFLLAGSMALQALSIMVIAFLYGILTVTFSGYFLPLLILLQPLLISRLSPFMPKLISKNSGQMAAINDRSSRKSSLKFRPWIHPGLRNYQDWLIFSFILLIYAFLGLFFYLMASSFFIPIDSYLWNSWIFN